MNQIYTSDLLSMETPLNELKFVSIKEKKENKD